MQQQRFVVVHRNAGPHLGLFSTFLCPQALVVAAEAGEGRDGTTMRPWVLARTSPSGVAFTEGAAVELYLTVL